MNGGWRRAIPVSRCSACPTLRFRRSTDTCCRGAVGSRWPRTLTSELFLTAVDAVRRDNPPKAHDRLADRHRPAQADRSLAPHRATTIRPVPRRGRRSPAGPQRRADHHHPHPRGARAAERRTSQCADPALHRRAARRRGRLDPRPQRARHRITAAAGQDRVPARHCDIHDRRRHRRRHRHDTDTDTEGDRP